MSSPAFAGDDSSADAVTPEILAARLISKLCHDFANSVGGVVTGLDLLNDPTAKDMRDDAMELLSSSARKLADQLAFARIAYGATAGADGVDTGELERIARGAYAQVRAELDWRVQVPALPKAPAQVLLHIAQLAAAALPFGGVARIEAWREPGRYVLLALAQGGRARLHQEVEAGLAGQPLGDGIVARWVQAYYARLLARGAGGDARAEAEGELVTFRAWTQL
jgi:histidine phosphotransferase ChpT